MGRTLGSLFLKLPGPKLMVDFFLMAYSSKVLDHYNNPRNVGSFDKADTNVGTGVVGAPECGK